MTSGAQSDLLDELLHAINGIFEGGHDAVLIASERSDILYVNDTLVRLFGYEDKTDLIGKSLEALMTPDVAANHHHHVALHLSDAPSPIMDRLRRLKGRKANGDLVTLDINVTEYRQGDAVNFVAFIRDMTYVEQKENELHQAVYFDPLTGFPNQINLIGYLSDYFDRKPMQEMLLGLVSIMDIREINETFGIDKADTIIQKVAERLKSELRDIDFIGRIGAGVFAITVKSDSTEDAINTAEALNRKISDMFNAPVSVGNLRPAISLAQGYITLPEFATTPETAIRVAELVLADAKEQKDEKYLIADPKRIQDRERKTWMPHNLREAIQASEFHVVFQPKLDVATGHFKAAEALIRWENNGQFISPMEFIPVAETTGLINNLGQFVFHETVHAFARLREVECDTSGLRFAINLSAVQLEDDGLADYFHDEVMMADIPSHHFEFEITETAMAAKPEAVLKNLKALRLSGFTVALDDFGVGYSSLHALSEFPLDRVKLDRSFLKGIQTDTRQFSLVKNTISLARDLGLDVTVEGVETEEIANLVKLLGADELQGYLYAKPVPFEELVPFLHQERPVALSMHAGNEAHQNNKPVNIRRAKSARV